MWMLSFPLRALPLYSNTLSLNFPINFQWRILVTFITFWVYRLCGLWILCFFRKLVIYKTSSPNLISINWNLSTYHYPQGPRYHSGWELLSDPSIYRSMIGALQYLTMTRLDLAFAVNLVSQFMHASSYCSLSCCGNFRYLQGTTYHGLVLKQAKDLSMMVAYWDANWARRPHTSRSTAGYAVFWGPNLVYWRSKKQPTVSKSSTEVEYRVVAYTAIETLWIRWYAYLSTCEGLMW